MSARPTKRILAFDEEFSEGLGEYVRLHTKLLLDVRCNADSGKCGRTVAQAVRIHGVGIRLFARIKAHHSRASYWATTALEEEGHASLRCPRHKEITLTSTTLTSAIDAGRSVLPLNPDAPSLSR